MPPRQGQVLLLGFGMTLHRSCLFHLHRGHPLYRRPSLLPAIRPRGPCWQVALDPTRKPRLNLCGTSREPRGRYVPELPRSQFVSSARSSSFELKTHVVLSQLRG